MIKVMLVIVCLMSQFAMAGDASEYTSLGFSKDGQYYSYVQDGFHDGSGAYWVELGIIDVKNNRYMGRKQIMQDMQDDQPINESEIPKMLAKLKKQLAFESYGFLVKAKEKVLISRPHNDLSSYQNSVFTLEYWAQGGASMEVKSYELFLKEIKAEVNVHNEWCDGWYGSNSMIELRMEFNDPYDDGVKVKQDLQLDTHQPKSRACSFNYSVAFVMNDKNSLAVVLKYSGPGFEGPDNRYMIVTAKIK